MRRNLGTVGAVVGICYLCLATAAAQNDFCAEAIEIAECVQGGQEIPFSNIGATNDGPSECGALGSDIWYCYQGVPDSDPTTVSTCGSGYDTVLSVFGPFEDCAAATAACPPAGAVACNDDSCGLQSSVSFPSDGGAYLIQVGGWLGAQGDGVLAINQDCTPDVEIDIKPGSDPNCVNAESKGLISAAILSTDVFDATQVDPDSVQLGGESARRCADEDVDSDGDLDLVCKFKTENVSLPPDGSDCGSVELTASTFDGTAYEGEDTVCVPGEFTCEGWIMLASTAAFGELIEVDPATGAGTALFPHGSFGPVTEIELRSDGTLFGSTGGGFSNIIQIDTNTGLESLVGPHVFGAVQGMEFVGGTLYGTYVPGPGDPSELVTVNQSTGALTFIGPTGLGSIGGLAYDEATGTMYGTESSTNFVGFSRLVTINLATGAATLVGATGFFDVAALEFGPYGVLYGGIGGNSPTPGDVITIDPATGAGTSIGNTGFPRVSGIAFLRLSP